MITPITGTAHANPLRLPETTAIGPRTPPAGVDFQQMLLQSLQDAVSMQQKADTGVQESLLQGDMTNVEVLTAVKKADLTLRMLMQIRNKVLEAYNEIKQMRM